MRLIGLEYHSLYLTTIGHFGLLGTAKQLSNN